MVTLIRRAVADPRRPRAAPQVVPLYGRGGNGKDPRKLPVDGVPIPSRPAAQRPPVQVCF